MHVYECGEPVVRRVGRRRAGGQQADKRRRAHNGRWGGAWAGRGWRVDNRRWARIARAVDGREETERRATGGRGCGGRGQAGREVMTWRSALRSKTESPTEITFFQL